MQIPIFKAKDKDSDEYVEGFYVEYPITNAPQSSSVETNIAHCIFVHKPGMMGLINEPYVCSIDFGTLEFVKYIEVPCSAGKIIL